jgi:hypothetical protein
MKSLRRRRWNGVLSLVWACTGFFALYGDYFHFSPRMAPFVVFGAWWGVAILLAAGRSSPGLDKTPERLIRRAAKVLPAGLARFNIARRR